jgi:hypothetical protein
MLQIESGNGALKRIFGCQKDDRRRRKFHTENLNNLYSSSNIIRIIKSRRVRCVGHVACMGVDKRIQRTVVTERKRRQYITWNT